MSIKKLVNQDELKSCCENALENNISEACPKGDFVAGFDGAWAGEDAVRKAD